MDSGTLFNLFENQFPHPLRENVNIFQKGILCEFNLENAKCVVIPSIIIIENYVGILKI